MDAPSLSSVAGFGAGLLTGVLGGWISSATEPVNRWIGRFGRRVTRTSGVQIHVETDPAQIWAGMPPWIGARVFVPGNPSDCTPPDNPLDWLKWAEEMGGCASGEAVIELTLSGDSPATVVLAAPRVSVEKTALPPGFIGIRPVGGAEISPRGITVDLDQFGYQHPVVDMGQDTWDGERMPKRWTLAKGDVEVFILRVKLTQDYAVAWKAVIPMHVDGRKMSATIDNKGKPFYLCGDASTARIWDGGSWIEC